MIYLSALAGSILFIAIQLKIEKEKDDKCPRYRTRWNKYFKKNWDDFLFSVAAGQVLAYFQESLFFGWVEWKDKDYDKMLDFYVEAEQAIAGGLGLFGSLLIMILFRFVMRKASKLDE